MSIRSKLFGDCIENWRMEWGRPLSKLVHPLSSSYEARSAKLIWYPFNFEQPENTFENDLSESDDLDKTSKGTRRKTSAAAPRIGSTSIPKSAFRTHLAGEAADASLKTISAGVLTHAGFEGRHFWILDTSIAIANFYFFRRWNYLGSSTVALDVITHVTAEYMMNLGRTLKFYADRQGDKMSSEVGSFSTRRGILRSDC